MRRRAQQKSSFFEPVQPVPVATGGQVLTSQAPLVRANQEDVRREVVVPSCGSGASVQDISQKFQGLEATLISTVKVQIAQFMASPAHSQLPGSGEGSPVEARNLVYDLQVIGSDNDICHRQVLEADE